MLTSMELQIQHWKFLYRVLSHKQSVEAKITTIDLENEKVREKVIKMLTTWIQGERESATFRTLINALESGRVERPDIAGML